MVWGVVWAPGTVPSDSGLGCVWMKASLSLPSEDDPCYHYHSTWFPLVTLVVLLDIWIPG